VASSHEARTDYDRNRNQLMAVQSALRELDRMSQGGHGNPAGLAILRGEYEGRLAGVEAELERMRETHSSLHDAELLRARRHLLMVEKAEAIEANHQGLVNREAYEKVLADIDARLVQLNDPEGA
jgi:hypothetical protein